MASSFHGMKMLATGTPVADEIWIGNILPLAPEAKARSITFAVPCNAAAVCSGRANPSHRRRRANSARLTWRFDEPDAMVMFDNVKVPWNACSFTTIRP